MLVILKKFHSFERLAQVSESEEYLTRSSNQVDPTHPQKGSKKVNPVQRNPPLFRVPSPSEIVPPTCKEKARSCPAPICTAKFLVCVSSFTYFLVSELLETVSHTSSVVICVLRVCMCVIFAKNQPPASSMSFFTYIFYLILPT